MGRRLHILVGMTLTVAVVVPLALAQQKDPGAGNDVDTVLDLGKAGDLPPVPQTELPPVKALDSASAAPARRPGTARGQNKRSSALAKGATARTRTGEIEPTPGTQLGSGPLAASEVGPASEGAASARSDPQASTTAPFTALKEREDEISPVPPQPPVGPQGKPGAVPSPADALAADGNPSGSTLRDRSQERRGTSEPGRLPLVEERTLDPEVVLSQAPTPGQTGASQPAGAGAAPDPGSALGPAKELPLSPGGSAGLAGSSNPLFLPASTVPMGKQSVGLSVDVQAPQFANLHQDTTLKIVVRNTGQSDALSVLVADPLPEGLEFVSSEPPAKSNDRILIWTLDKVAAGSDHTILVRVRPNANGPFDHAATVTMLAASKSRTMVRQPKLKVEQSVSPAHVEKGQQVEFKIRVSNPGDGPARNVLIQATLSPGLRHDSGTPNEQNLLEQSIDRLEPGTHVDLDPLIVDAVGGGPQSCSVLVTSKDVVTAAPDPDSKHTQLVQVTEPKLVIKLDGPSEQYTDTEAPYTLTVTNPGTATTRKITARAFLQITGQLMRAAEGYKYNPETRTLAWVIPQLGPGQTKSFQFDVRMPPVGVYTVKAAAQAAGALHFEDDIKTTVKGMADVSFQVSERRRVVGVNGETTFVVKITNAGTMEATKIIVTGEYSDKIEPVGNEADPNDKTSNEQMAFQKDQRLFKFSDIASLGPGKSKTLRVRVKAIQPGFASCTFSLMHDGLPEKFKLINIATFQVSETARK